MKILILALILIHFLCHGDETMNAAKQTEDFLKNKKERDAWVQKNAPARDADAKAEALAGAAGKEEMYGMAAELNTKLAAEAGGDPEKMKKILEEAQKNPQAFYEKYFSADQKAKIRETASKINSQKAAVGAPK